LDYLELNGTKVEFSKGITTLIGPSGSGKSQIFLTIHSILRLWAEGIGPSSAQKATAKNLTKARLGVSWPSPAFGDVKLALGFDNETKQSEFLGTPPKGQPTWHSWYFAKAVADRLAKVLILVPQDHGLGYGNGFAPTHNWVIQAKDEINGLTTTYNTSALNEDLQKITNIRLTKPSSFALLNFKSSGKLFSSEQNKIHNANISGMFFPSCSELAASRVCLFFGRRATRCIHDPLRPPPQVHPAKNPVAR
jgi:energy-coupling factor transporter ATP-binding protein EcfA2